MSIDEAPEEISFGQWLRQRRRMLDLTQQALADQVGCARITLRRIESGGLKPSKDLAQILLDKLGIPEIEHPQWVLFARGLSDFPTKPGASSTRKPLTNLPAPLTTFIGREKEQAEILTIISKYRLITLVGSGGVGKTRLSIKVGEKVLEIYTDGVWLVELSPIFDPILLPRTTAITIGLRDEPKRPVIDMLCDYVREKKMLIILDNCEHLLDAGAQLVATLLKHCPNLKILVTSREALGILGEAVYHVPSLELPNMLHLHEKFRDYESIRLFEERAQLVRLNFSLTIENASSVATICNRLDGIPLAIELAAARISTFSTEQIAARLRESFDLLTTGNRIALPRHQTLQAAIDWSYDMLSPVEQTLFRRLSVFVHGWTLEAADAICSDARIKSEAILDLLTQLINKSLVIMDETQGETRYHMLETIRQYASEKLVEFEKSDPLRDRHLEYFLNLAETAEPHLVRSEQIKWLPLLDADYENLRLALESALSNVSAEPSLRLCTALGMFWAIRCHWTEGSSWLTKALAKPGQAANKNERVARTRASYTHALLEWQLGNIEEMHTSAKTSLALASENSNERDLAMARYLLAVALLQRREDDDLAFSLLEQCFTKFQDLQDSFWQARSFSSLGFLPATRAKLSLQNAILRNVELARKSGERLTVADALTTYADWLFKIGHLEEAKEQIEESERLYKQIGSENLWTPLVFAEMAWSEGDPQRAKSILLKLQQRCAMLGQKSLKSICNGQLGILTMEEGDLNQARAYFEEALAFEKEAGWQTWVEFYLIELGNLFYQQGKIEEFKQNFRESLSLRSSFSEYHKVIVLMTMLGSLYSENLESSARLLGVIDKHETVSDFPPTWVDKRYCRRAESRAREILGNITFECLFVEGQKISLSDGLDLALKTVEEI